MYTFERVVLWDDRFIVSSLLQNTNINSPSYLPISGDLASDVQQLDREADHSLVFSAAV
jgi:hypothetical protein